MHGTTLKKDLHRIYSDVSTQDSFRYGSIKSESLCKLIPYLSLLPSVSPETADTCCGNSSMTLIQ